MSILVNKHTKVITQGMTGETGTFHTQHGIFPKAPDAMQLQPLAARIYSSVSLKNISLTTGVNVDTLRQLNPSFKRDYTPARANGIFLVLPKNTWYDYLDAKNNTAGSVAARP